MSIVNHSFLVGLTGPIGAGKTHVASIWKSLGAGIVEGDVMGRLALAQDRDLVTSLAIRFGDEILGTDGAIDRAILANRAFNSQDGAIDLTNTTFPVLYRIAREHFKREAEQHDIVVFDAALIYEWHVESDFDLMVVVAAPEEFIIQNAARRLNTDIEHIKTRLNSQISQDVKSHKADIVIENDGNLNDLTEKAETAWKRILDFHTSG